MEANKTKAKLKAGETVFGAYLRHADPGLAEVLAHYGWDYLLFDGEHCPLTERDCENLARVSELRDVTPIVRVPVNQPSVIGRFLDTGMQGIQIPMVNSAEEAQAVVRAVKYQPLGTRGLAAARAANYGQSPGFVVKEHIEKANAETLVIVQVETVAGMEQTPRIAEIPGIDVIFIGPMDLSHSLGVAGELRHPKLLSACDSIASAVKSRGKALGIMVGNAEAAIEWKERGARYIMIVLEALIAPAVRGFLKTVRGV